ncbi:MAG: hypothetical protein KME18_23015 [Phormidium tanganyikae FI6-MK23]|nr:hypothetical protein [Phormidium tanganyikae FI6-MK23]
MSAHDLNSPTLSRPFTHGHTFSSPGGHFTYRVIGPCCRLFDREQLPYPCCRIEWHGKEPSWRRIGRRFIVDLATRNSPSYNVEIVGREAPDLIILTLYWIKLPQPLKAWWHSTKPATAASTKIESAEDIKIEG